MIKIEIVDLPAVKIREYLDRLNGRLIRAIPVRRKLGEEAYRIFYVPN